jgi:hypothetical protein
VPSACCVKHVFVPATAAKALIDTRAAPIYSYEFAATTILQQRSCAVSLLCYMLICACDSSSTSTCSALLRLVKLECLDSSSTSTCSVLLRLVMLECLDSSSTSTYSVLLKASEPARVCKLINAVSSGIGVD